MKIFYLSLIITISASSFLNISASEDLYNGFQKKIEVPAAASLPIRNITADYCVKKPQSGMSTLNCEGLIFKLHVLFRAY